MFPGRQGRRLTAPSLDPRDLPLADASRVASALGRFRVEVIDRSSLSSFDQAYDALDGFFGAKGEMEERRVTAALVDAPRIDYRPGLVGHYRLIAAWQGDQLAAARDCWIDLDAEQGICQIALSHVWVAPGWRRSGLAALLRALPVSMGRELAREQLGPDHTLVVAAEMEPVDPREPDTVVRLLAYGRAGFSVLDPRRVPYSQPDFRPLRPLGAAIAMPLLPLVRLPDLPDVTAVPVWIAAAFPRLFHAGHRLSMPAERVDPSEGHALETLTRSPEAVALLPLPRGPNELARLAPLVRGAVLPLYPELLRGSDPEPGDAAAQLAAVVRTWGPPVAAMGRAGA